MINLSNAGTLAPGYYLWRHDTDGAWQLGRAETGQLRAMGTDNDHAILQAGQAVGPLAPDEVAGKLVELRVLEPGYADEVAEQKRRVLGMGLVQDAFRHAGGDRIKVDACLSVDRPASIKDFEQFREILLAAYDQGYAAGLAASIK